MRDAFIVISSASTEDQLGVWPLLTLKGSSMDRLRGYARIRNRPKLFGHACVDLHAKGPRTWVIDRVRTPVRSCILAAVALTGLAGCGQIDLGKRKWSCSKQAVQYEVTDSLQPGDKLWRFDDGAMDQEVKGDAGDRLTIATTPQLSDLPEVVGIGGEGTALVVPPNSISAQSENALALGPSVTYTAWISLRKSWLVNTPEAVVILSTMDDSRCVGHELALSVSIDESGTQKVMLKFAYFDSGCAKRSLNAFLPGAKLASADTWGLGKWYHVAAVVKPVGGSSLSEITLYWDGMSIESREKYEPNSDISEVVLNIGSSADGSNRFAGKIDDVGLFQRALEADELGRFLLASSSKFEMNGYRWATWESARSVARWSSSQQNGLAIDCIDEKSSGCGAYALLNELGSAPLKLESLDHITLDAELPAGQKVDFTLATDNGRQFCKWAVEGVGGAEYDFAVTERSDRGDAVHELKWCQCDTCDCNFDVETAMVGSEWTPRVNPFSCLFCGLRPYLTVTDVALARHHAGAVRNNGGLERRPLCWRALAFDADSHARLDASPHETSVAAKLSGPVGTTALLAADFGADDTFLNLKDVFKNLESDRREIVVCAYLPVGSEFQLHLQSENGGYCQVKISGRDKNNTSSSRYPVESFPPKSGEERMTWTYLQSCMKQPSPSLASHDEEGRPAIFDPTKIRYIGIQKAWESSAAVNIRIDSLGFNRDHHCSPNGANP